MFIRRKVDGGGEIDDVLAVHRFIDFLFPKLKILRTTGDIAKSRQSFGWVSLRLSLCRFHRDPIRIKRRVVPLYLFQLLVKLEVNVRG